MKQNKEKRYDEIVDYLTLYEKGANPTDVVKDLDLKAFIPMRKKLYHFTISHQALKKSMIFSTIATSPEKATKAFNKWQRKFDFTKYLVPGVDEFRGTKLIPNKVN